MAIDDYKVTNAEVQAAHVQAAPNTLTGTAQENKAVFDGYPELLKEKHNGLIDELDDALAEQVDWEEDDDTMPAYIKNKPIIKEGTGTGSIIENDTNNIASGTNSHAEGYLTKAVESFTHVNGVGTEAHGYAETVIGQYNDYDAMTEPYVFVIGNGYEDGDRSNAHTTDWQGNAWYAGEVTDGSGNVLSDKANSSDMTTALTGKVDKVTGKGLSTNDYTTAEKMKLSGIEAGAEVNVQADWETNDTNSDAYIKNKPYIPNKTSDLTNDSNYATEAYVENGLDGKVDKETGKGLSANDYTSEEKAKLEDIEAGAEVNVQSDWLQNNSNADDYIKNKPTLPTKTSDLTNDSDYTTKEYVDGKLPIGEASGSIASVKDGADGMPMKSLTATIVPQQSGSGTPSPENVRPISGWESVETSVSGVNVWDEEWENGSLSEEGADTPSSNSIRSKNYISVSPNTAYCIVTPYTVYMRYYDANKEFISKTDANGRGNVTAPNGIRTMPSNCAYVRFYIEQTTYNHDISINYPSTDHDYHAYTATTHTTSLGRTVYGGTVDVVRGTLKAYPYYASYNGETLDGEWVCDRAVYAQGATPPIGSQVALISGESTTYQLTPQTINTLAGVSNVWADSGDCSIEYVRDIGLALDNLLPDTPTTDGTYTLVCTVSDGKATLAWQSSGASLSSPLSLSSPTVLNSTNDTETRKVSLTEEEGDSNEIR